MDGGAWWAAVHGITKSRTRLSDFTFTFHFHALEKEMATHSSVLAWRIPGMGEPGGLLSMGSHKFGHDWNDLAAASSTGLCQRYSKTDTNSSMLSLMENFLVLAEPSKKCLKEWEWAGLSSWLSWVKNWLMSTDVKFNILGINGFRS